MSEDFNDSDEIDPKYIADQLKKIKENMSKYYQKCIKNEKLLVLIGCTGSGKTTLAYLLAGQQLNTIAGDIGFSLEPKEKSIKSLGNIGHTCFAETYTPGFVQVNNVKIIDMAGIGDNRGINLRVINGLMTEELLPKDDCYMRVLIVMSTQEFQARKANTAKIIFEAVESFLEEKQWESSLGIVVTKISSKRGEKPQKFFDFMKKGDYKGNLLSFFKQHPSNVFELPFPEQLGPYTPPQDLIQNIIQFSQNAPLSKSENRGLLIDGETLKDLYFEWNQLSYDYQEQITGPSGLLTEIKKYVIENIDSLENINKMMEYVKLLRDEIQKGLKEFEEALKSNIDILPNSEQVLKIVEVFAPMNDFFEKCQRFANICKLLDLKSPIVDFSKWTFEALNTEVINIEHLAQTAKTIDELKEKGRIGEENQKELQQQIEKQKIELEELARKTQEDINEKDRQMDEMKRNADLEIGKLNGLITGLQQAPQKVIERVIEKPVYQVVEKTVERGGRSCLLI